MNPESNEPGSTQPLVGIQRDRYPRMILVCIGISCTLFFVIATTLLIDFALRFEENEPEATPEEFKSLLEPPREAYSEQP